MRYEHIVLDISTAGCAAVLDMLDEGLSYPEHVRAELLNLQNELRARLQRRDADPHSPKNAAPAAEGWLEV